MQVKKINAAISFQRHIYINIVKKQVRQAKYPPLRYAQHHRAFYKINSLKLFYVRFLISITIIASIYVLLLLLIFIVTTIIIIISTILCQFSFIPTGAPQGPLGNDES